MPAVAATTPAEPSADYRRQARRLRTVYGGRPVQLYRELSRLSREQDAKDFRRSRETDVISRHRGESFDRGDFSPDNFPRTVVCRRVVAEPVEQAEAAPFLEETPAPRVNFPADGSFDAQFFAASGQPLDESEALGAARFGNLCALQFEGAVLRYSRRLSLFKAAEKLGISRFHANLVIALVQHRLNSQPTAGPTYVIEPKTSGMARKWFPRIILVALIQAAIVAAIWMALRT